MVKLAILNNFLATFGGGEKNTYALASTLSRSGFEVDVFTFEERAPTPAEVSEFYGPGHDGFRIASLAEPGLDPAARDERLTRHLRPYTVFINQCAGSSFANPCPLGIYSVMFPFQDAGEWVRCYHHFLCNSGYTEFYVHQRWGPELQTTVLYPAVDEAPCDAATPRAREILSVGRFTWEGHAKNQDLLVEVFEKVRGALPPGWTLTLLGRTHQDPDTASRMERLRQACRDLPVRLELNVSNEQKRAALRRAAIYWHGTGIGRTEPEDAARMEHFGIAIVEAMSSGAIPMCYHRGGAREIVRHAESGFLYRDADELATFTRYVANSPHVEARLRRSTVGRAGVFGRSRFDAELNAFLSSCLAM